MFTRSWKVLRAKWGKCTAFKWKQLANSILWNNKFICIGGKSVYIRNLAEKGIIRIGDLIADTNELIIKNNRRLREL